MVAKLVELSPPTGGSGEGKTGGESSVPLPFSLSFLAAPPFLYPNFFLLSQEPGEVYASYPRDPCLSQS